MRHLRPNPVSDRSGPATIPSHPDAVRRFLWAAATLLLALAAIVRIGRIWPEAEATARPFLILSLILVAGALLDRLGLFRRLASSIVRSGTGRDLAVPAVLVLVALLSALVNLDVAVVVAMPVAIRVARRTGVSAGALAIGVAITANAASFLLPTSNLTNLLVMGGRPLGVPAYLRGSWLPWACVVVLTIGALTALLARTERRPAVAATTSQPAGSGPSLGTLVDLIPMYAAATAIRALLGVGLVLPGGTVEQAAAGSLLAAAANNLPMAAAVHATTASAVWAGILAMAIGPNLLVTGSVATLICRRLARDAGADLDPIRFSLVGTALLPLQLGVAVVALHLVGVL